MGLLTIYRKTFADLSDPKLLGGYLVPYLGVAWFFGLVVAEGQLSEAGTPLAQQEAELFASFMFVSFFWAAGIPVLALGSVLAANTLAKEAEQGTLRILLSKPVSRWKILLGTFGGIVTFAGVVTLASLLLQATLIVGMSSVSAAAIPGGIFATLRGTLPFALFGAAVVTSIGLCLAVFTQSRLRTALGALVLPAFYFAFFPIRLLSGTMYEDYALYLVDVNYHFGNAFVFVHEAFGGALDVQTQLSIALWTGVYRVPEEKPEQLPESLELTGHVSMEASVLLLALLAIVAVAATAYRLERMDV